VLGPPTEPSVVRLSRPAGRLEEAPQVESMRRAPMLAGLTALAAFTDLAWNRIGIRLVDENARAVWIPLVEHGRFFRNLAGLGGLVTVLVAIGSLLRVPSPLQFPWRGLVVRLALSGVAGLYLPGIALSVLVGRSHVPSLVVLLQVLGGSALVAILGSATLPYRRVAQAWPGLLAGLTASLAMVGLLVASLRTIVPAVGVLGLTARHGAECLWLLTPLTLLLDPELRSHYALRRARASLGAVAATAVLGLACWLQVELRDDSARIAYGAFRVAMLPEPATWAYGIPLGLAAGLAVLHLLWPERRQLGLALVLWLAAGLAPRSTAGVLYEVASALLFARAAIAAHPDGRLRLVPFAADFDRTG
jgi:hypothetical protein